MMNDIDIQAQIALSNTLDEMLATARPRLLRLAQQQGVLPDAADDVVQETLVEAWRHLEHLHSRDRFDAWLNGICRNVSLRWNRTHSITKQRQESLSVLVGAEQDSSFSDIELDIPDPLAIDPAEELSRQDLATLLDRAMGYLPSTTRKALELHYLAEMPQSETALQLGLTINALEVRLHRARRQLRQVLSNELRNDAEAFGMAIDKDMVQGWRKTGIGCLFCGRSSVDGLFETLPDGRVNLRMRCPSCGNEWFKSGGMSELCGLRSFRPAFKRALQVGTDYWASPYRRQTCSCCGKPVHVQLIGHDETPSWLAWSWQGLRFVMECYFCDSHMSQYVGGILWLHPLAQDFIKNHPRWINTAEKLTEYANQPALQISLVDVMSAARLTILVHRETLQVLASFQE